MHKKFFIVTAILLAVAAGLATSAFAQGAGHRFGHKHGWMLKRMTRELNLTEAQQTQIKGIMTDSKTRIKPLMQQLQQNRQAANTNMSATFDEARARTFANQQSQIMSNLIVERQRTQSQIYSVLTPDQRQKALQLMQQHEQRRQERLQKKSDQTQQTQSK